MNINDKRLQEQKKYEWLSKHNKSYGSTNHGKSFAQYILDNSAFPLIDIGCGKNNFVQIIKQKVSEPVIAIGIDFAFKEADIVCSANNIPVESNFFNAITSFDFFEHLLEEDIDNVIKEIIRIANNKALFLATISSRDSFIRGPKGETLHPTVRPISWWIEKFKAHNISLEYTNNLYKAEIIK